MTPTQQAYQRGVEIADVLLSRGYPVIKVSAVEDGSAIVIGFGLTNQPAAYFARIPIERAGVERFIEAYEAVA
jgi:hypothetical protein